MDEVLDAQRAAELKVALDYPRPAKRWRCGTSICSRALFRQLVETAEITPEREIGLRLMVFCDGIILTKRELI